jgi:hypothetical protein
MLGRAIGLVAGLSGAATLSQFPEYSQQYVQRLGGAVDELHRFVAAFDEDAEQLDLSRDEALHDLAQGGEMGAARAETMEATITRYERLKADLATLRSAGPFTRAYHAARLTDPEIASAAWDDYRPAMPLTFEGAVFGGTGFLAGLGAIGVIVALLRGLIRRRPSKIPG